ncbi:MAG: hypothetical protein V7L03_10290 [Nostoc sp.]
MPYPSGEASYAERLQELCGLRLRFFAISIQNMGLCSLSQHLRSLQFLPVCSHSDALSIQGIDVEWYEFPMEANKLALNKGNNKDKIINVQIGRVIKYPVSSTMLL